ncbi:hypothetical protein [Nonomuraea bangladeshensis]|uniref:hypothetical protein n=1 Tax=Nonomuraea bangladeshensis TaxID=404385 RepID=UPI003C2D77CD
MATRKSPWQWISLLAGGLLAGALGVIFIMLDLEQADQLASVVGVFITLIGLGVSVYGVVLARRGEASSPATPVATAPSASDADASTAQGERSVAARVNSGVIQTGDHSQATITRTGNTTNRIEGGTFHAPVTMARDITGPPTAQPPQPRDPSSDDPDISEHRR